MIRKHIKTICTILFVLLLAGCGKPETNAINPQASASPANIATQLPTNTPEATPTPSPTPSPSPAAKPAPTVIDLMAVGDIISHEPMIAAAYDRTTKTYDFSYQFQYIKDIIGSADLALGNFECTCGGPNKPYSKNKYFNAPDTVVDAIKGAGFDVLSTANNHAYDTGSDGMQRTIDVIRKAGLQNVGTRKDASEKPYIIVDVKGIKIGIAAYTYEDGSGKDTVALNGKRVKPEDINLVSVFDRANMTDDLAKMEQTAKDMRSAGADLVIFFVHWGIEYQRAPSAQQKAMAQGLAEAGVDIIFGSHPHVMQPIDVIDSAQTGKRTYVVYSMGNFIANMREEYTDPSHSYKYTEDGMIADVKITKDPDSGKVSVSSFGYLPTWTYMYYAKGVRKFTVVPLPQALADPGAFGITSKTDINKAQTSYDHTQKLFADAVGQGWLKMVGGGN